MLEKGDIVQISPDFDCHFSGCFMIVTEPRTWGAQGYIANDDPKKGLAYFRCETAHMTLVGHAEWMKDHDV